MRPSSTSAPIASPSKTAPSARTSRAGGRASERARLSAGRVHRCASPSTTTGSPAKTVWRTLPVSRRPAKGVLRLRLAWRLAVDDPLVGRVEHHEVGDRAGSRSARPGRPGRGRRSRAGRQENKPSRSLSDSTAPAPAGTQPVPARVGSRRRRSKERCGRPRARSRARASRRGLVEGVVLALGRRAARGRWRWRRRRRSARPARTAATSSDGPQRRVDLVDRVVARDGRVAQARGDAA